MTTIMVRGWLTVALLGLAASCGGSGTASDAASAADSTDGGTADGDGAVSEAGGPITPELCTQMCEVALQIVCPGELTMQPCVDMCLADTATCATQVAAFYHCVVTDGPSALMCDSVQMLIVTKDGFCVTENQDLATCFSM